MYPYHNQIKRRIYAGELVDFYYTDSYPNIGAALVLVFSTAPFKRPVRQHRYQEYQNILSQFKGGLNCGVNDSQGIGGVSSDWNH